MTCDRIDAPYYPGSLYTAIYGGERSGRHVSSQIIAMRKMFLQTHNIKLWYDVEKRFYPIAN